VGLAWLVLGRAYVTSFEKKKAREGLQPSVAGLAQNLMHEELRRNSM